MTLSLYFQKTVQMILQEFFKDEKTKSNVIFDSLLLFNSLSASLVIFHAFLWSADSMTFFQNCLKSSRNTISESQTVWVQIRTNKVLVLIWVQTVCKGYNSADDKSPCYQGKS